jgi:predicted lipid-binding transport protein (Tim44 family)
MTTYDEPEFDEPTPPEESSNRTFLLVAGILGGLVLLGLLCIVGYFFFRNASNQQNQGTAIAQATQQEATIRAGVTQTSIAQNQTQTAAVTNTVPPTNTPVIAEATATFSPTPAPATVTVAAAFTQLAESTQTIIATSTALPSTGIAEDLGASGLILVAIALVAVIFLVRRLRSSPSH